MSFDITIAFDKAEYLNPQARLFISTLKDNIPKDTILHVVTNRTDEDEIVKYIQENINSKFYFIEKSDELKSRCRYMLNCFKIKTNKEWIIKMELDMLTLKHLSALENILEADLDCVLEPENRRIYSGAFEKRLWRSIHKAMGFPNPTQKIIFRENNEEGLALFGTGMICVRKELLDKINKEWIPLTKKAEPWLNMNVHSNEQAFTGLVLNSGWRWKIYKDIYKYNPIGHFRKGDFPSTNLIDDCKLPEDTVIFDYHRPKWLMHVAKYNKNVGDIICDNNKYIPEDWWKSTNDEFQEK